MASFITVTSRVEDRDLGWKAIKARIRSLNGRLVDNGFPEDGKTSGRYSMVQMADVAAKNEFGSGSAPARSFLRSSFDSGIKNTFRAIKKNVELVGRGTISAENAMQNLGKFSVRQIRKRIQFGRFTPLAPATIAKKGHSTPLLETGQMFETVQFKVGRFGR